MIVYKAWIEIEEYDTESGDGRDLDAPGSSLATFETYDEAYQYCEDIVTRAAEHPAANQITHD